MVASSLLLLHSGSLHAGTRIEQDPQGFLGIPWGTSLTDRAELQEIDSIDVVKIFSRKDQSPSLGGILMASMKLYTLEGQYARATFHYEGVQTHHALLEFLQRQFGTLDTVQGGMMRGLNQQYTWRGPETEISLSYHGFRERGFLTAQSRILSPLFFDAFPDRGY